MKSIVQATSAPTAIVDELTSLLLLEENSRDIAKKKMQIASSLRGTC